MSEYEATLRDVELVTHNRDTQARLTVDIPLEQIDDGAHIDTDATTDLTITIEEATDAN